MDMNTPGIGDNTQSIADIAKNEHDRLKSEYAYLETKVEELEAAAAPITVVDSAEVKSTVTLLIKQMREQYKRLKGVHEAEAAPHLERHRGTNSFFFGLMDRLGRRDKKSNPGAADRLNSLLTDYDIRMEAIERERRQREADEAARIAREAEDKRLAAEAEAEAARLAAERARKPETQVAKEEVAVQKADEASAARVDATVAIAKAEEVRAATLATSADIMRQRSDDGVLSTMGTEKFKEITDRNALDLDKLRPYIPMAALETALGKYAESVGYSSDASVQIKGAKFGKKPKSRVI